MTNARGVGALRNAWSVLRGADMDGGEPTPTTVLYDEPHRQLRRYGKGPQRGNPILLVPPLAVQASCYDLRPGQSLAGFLLGAGHQPYVVDYGDMTYADRELGFEEWVDDIVPTAINWISADHGGAPVDVLGWSLGGTISLLTAGAHPELPIRSLTAAGTPIDYHKHPAMLPGRMLARVSGGREIDYFTKAFGGVPALAVRTAFRAQAFPREIGKPLYIARNLGDTEALARMQAVDRFISAMPGYPGRLYRQLYQRLVLRNELAKGRIQLTRDRVIELSTIAAPALFIGSRTDPIGPALTVAAGPAALANSAARYTEFSGISHLGLIAGPAARDTTWPVIAKFLAVVEREPALAGADSGS